MNTETWLKAVSPGIILWGIYVNFRLAIHLYTHVYVIYFYSYWFIPKLNRKIVFQESTFSGDDFLFKTILKHMWQTSCPLLPKPVVSFFLLGRETNELWSNRQLWHSEAWLQDWLYLCRSSIKGKHLKFLLHEIKYFLFSVPVLHTNDLLLLLLFTK